MVSLKHILLCCTALLFGIVAAAQTRLTGTITDKATGDPIAGATVVLDGSNVGAGTDAEGRFVLEVKPRNGMLTVSCMGYITTKVPFAGSQEFNISLEGEQYDLDEVVVVGYGVQRKSHLTGSISKFSGDNLNDVSVSNLDQALQGKIAGVNIQNVDQEAGAVAQIRIRGMGSISASNEPLVVIDGFPIADGLQLVNLRDVESIEVLKDAASAAIYGSRGANGVILITTKSGTVAKPKYSVGVYTGIRLPMKRYDMMNSVEYGQLMYREADMRAVDTTSGQGNLISVGERASYVLENGIIEPTDWQDEGLRDYAGISSYQLSISGGTKDLKYYISGGYLTEEGSMYHSKYNKLSFRAKMDGSLSKSVKFGVNVSPVYTMRENPATNFTDFWRGFAWMPVRHTQQSADFINNNDAPHANVRVGDWAQPSDFANLHYVGVMPDGATWDSWIDETGTNMNPSPSTSANNTPKSNMETQERFQHAYRLQGSAFLQWEPVKNLFIKTTENVLTGYTENEYYRDRNSGAAGNVNTATYTNRLLIDLLSENTANYLFALGKHDFTALAGYTFQVTTAKTAGISGSNFASDVVHTLNGANEINLLDTYTKKEKDVLISYFARLNWSYSDKYLASVSIRTDGSSKFNAEKWGWFPSASVGWRISEEKFMSPTKGWLKSLKLRGSYGVTGNNDIANYAFTDKLLSSAYSLGGGTGATIPGLRTTDDAWANPYITWEQTDEYDVGVDAGFWDNRLTATIDYYYSITKQMLFKQSAMGHSGHNQYWNNIGRVRNRGVEVELSSVNITTKSFTWRTFVNFAYNGNRLLELGGEAYQYSYGERNEVYAAIVGQPAIQFFGYKTDGVWLNSEQVEASGIKGGLSKDLGGLKIVDVNNDSILNAYDRVVIGTPFPDFTWSMTNAFTYKNFDFSFMLQGVQGGSVINGDAYYNETKKYNKAYTTNRWVSPQNPGDGKTPYINNGVDMMLSDYVVESASYVALRELSLGYTIPKTLMRRVHLSSLRVYLSAQNLLYFMGSGYRGLNPEARTTSNAYASPLVSGYQRGAFPLSRTVTVGMDITF
jgi:TonB-linked SusC/RagA family outer membrane protein